MSIKAQERWDFFFTREEWARQIKLNNATRIGDEEAQNLIFNLVHSQDEILARICERLSVSGDTFLRRWRKWTPTKRGKALDKLDDAHALWQGECSFIEVLVSEKGETRILDDQRGLLPYLNWASLSGQPERLLCLLRNRISTAPADWASIDRKQLNFLPMIDRYYKYSSRYGSTDPDNYGTLIPASTTRTQRMGFPALYVVLLAQVLLAKFLDSITGIVLDGADERGKGCSGWNNFVNEGTHDSNSRTPWPIYGNEPFSLPNWYQLPSIAEIASTRSQQAQDTIYSLQTDPPYVQRFLEQDTRMRTYIASNEANKASILTSSMLRPFRRVLFWEWVFSYFGERLSRVRDMDMKEAATWLWFFSLILDIRWGVCQDELRQMLPTQPNFDEHFKLNTLPTGEAELQANGSFEMCWENDPSYWALGWLSLANNHSSQIRRPLSTEQIFHMLDHHPSAENLNQGICDQLSEMADIDWIRCIVKKCGTSPSDTNEEAFKTCLRECRQTQVYNYKRRILDVQIEDISKSGSRLLAIVRGGAIAGPKNAHWLEKMTEARVQLSKFWTDVREYSWKKHPYAGRLEVKIPLATELGDEKALMKLKTEKQKEIIRMSADSSEQYLEMIVTERARIMESDSKADKIVPWEPQAWTRPVGFTEDNRINSKRAPVKTLTILNTTEEILETAHHKSILSYEPMAQSETAIVFVNKNHLETLRLLFSDPSAQGKMPRKLGWAVFAAAMQDAGFNLIQCNGSAVRFVSSRSPQGAIIFHKPHPDKTLAGEVLHGMGQRMHKWFGWKLEALRERDSESNTQLSPDNSIEGGRDGELGLSVRRIGRGDVVGAGLGT